MANVVSRPVVTLVLDAPRREVLDSGKDREAPARRSSRLSWWRCRVRSVRAGAYFAKP